MFACLFLILYVTVNNFKSCQDGSHQVEPVLSRHGDGVVDKELVHSSIFYSPDKSYEPWYVISNNVAFWQE